MGNCLWCRKTIETSLFLCVVCAEGGKPELECTQTELPADAEARCAAERTAEVGQPAVPWLQPKPTGS